MAYRIRPRVWPVYLRKCLCCQTPAPKLTASLKKRQTYAARGLCYPCYVAAKKTGNHRQWECSVPVASTNAVMSIVHHVGQTEAATALGVDRITLQTWARDSVPQARLADVYELLASLNLQAVLSKINQREDPLPYRTPEAAPTPFRHSSLADIK